MSGLYMSCLHCKNLALSSKSLSENRGGDTLNSTNAPFPFLLHSVAGRETETLTKDQSVLGTMPAQVSKTSFY